MLFAAMCSARLSTSTEWNSSQRTYFSHVLNTNILLMHNLISSWDCQGIS